MFLVVAPEHPADEKMSAGTPLGCTPACGRTERLFEPGSRYVSRKGGEGMSQGRDNGHPPASSAGVQRSPSEISSRFVVVDADLELASLF